MNRISPASTFGRLLIAVIDGEQRPAEFPDRASGCRMAGFLSDEDGMVAWATVVAVLFLGVLAALVYNAGQAINYKIETQNAADSVAYSSTLWTARGMNAVTAANHMAGELTALYVLHHAIGGNYLDTNDSQNHTTLMRITDIALWLAWLGAHAGDFTFPPVPPSDDAYNTVSQDPYSDVRSTIYDGKYFLKLALTAAYIEHLGGAMQFWQGVGELSNSFTFAAGLADMAEGQERMRAALAHEEYIEGEYEFLNLVENVAQATRPFKQAIPVVLDALWVYSNAIKVQIPAMQALAASNMGQRNRCTGAVSLSTMPLAEDPVSDVDHCQLMRAQYPWVRNWRYPITGVLSLGAPESFAGLFYIYWSDTYSEEVVGWFANRSGTEPSWSPTNRLALFLVKGLEQANVQKGQEAWTYPNQNALIEKQFCLMGYALRKPPPVAANRFFRQENPDGVLCFAQAICYNANYQTPPDDIDTGSIFQPRVGWDTLNWNSTGPDSNALEYHACTWGLFVLGVPLLPPIPVDFDGVFLPPPTPQIRLNWQAKLVPVTNSKLLNSIPVPLDSGIGKYLIDRPGTLLFPALNTH
jgi:hypothetical protein